MKGQAVAKNDRSSSRQKWFVKINLRADFFLSQKLLTAILLQKKSIMQVL